MGALVPCRPKAAFDTPSTGRCGDERYSRTLHAPPLYLPHAAPSAAPSRSSLSSLLPWLDSSLLYPFPTLCSSCTLHYYVLAPPLCAVLPLLQPHSAARFRSSPRPLTKGVDICLHHTPYQDLSLTNADATETFLNARHISGLTTINRYHCRPAAPSRPCCRLATLWACMYTTPPYMSLPPMSDVCRRVEEEEAAVTSYRPHRRRDGRTA